MANWNTNETIGKGIGGMAMNDQNENEWELMK